MRSGLLPRAKGMSLVGFSARSTVRAFRSMSDSSARSGGLSAFRSTFGAMNTNRASSRRRSSCFLSSSTNSCCRFASQALTNGNCGQMSIRMTMER
jgi:hypothetical protein